MSRFDFIRRMFAVTKPTTQDTSIVSVETSTYGIGAGIGTLRMNPDDLVRRKGLLIYAKMRNDEQVKAVCTFKRDAVLSRGWSLEYDEDSPLSDDERHKRISILKKIIDRMPGSFIDALNAISTGREFGFSLTEKVFQTIEIDGTTWTGLRKLVARDPTTFEFQTDPYGELVKCTQTAAGQMIDIDLDKFIYYVHNPEFDPYFGQSDLRPAYRSWYIKDQTLNFWAGFLERFGSGFLIGTLSGDNTPKFGTPAYLALQRAMSNARNGASMIAPQGVEVDIKYPASTEAYENACTWHDLAIARALLVPNLLGVSHTGTTGAFAQSQTQLEAFAWTVTADKLRLEACLTEQLIRDLCERNWGDGEYPRFVFNPVSMEHVRWLIATWGTLAQQGVVMATEDDEQRLRHMLDMPPRNDDSKLLTEVAAEKNPPPPPPPVMPQQQGGANVDEETGQQTQRRPMQANMRRSRFAFNPDQPRDSSGKWADGGGEQLSNEEVAAVHEYQSGLVGSEAGGYTNLQGMLRTGKPAYKDSWDAEKGALHLEALKSAFEKSATTEDMTVYRGVRVQKAGDQTLLNAKPGDILSDSGVLSTSKSREIVDKKFSTALNRSDTVVQMEIKVPAGSKAIDIGKVTGLSHEKEVALAPKTALRVVSRSVRNGVVRIKAEVVSPTKMSSFVCEDRHAFERAVERVSFAVVEKRQNTLAENLVTDMASVVARSVSRLMGDDSNLTKLTDADVEDIAGVELSGVEKGKLKNLAQRSLNSSWFVGQQMSQDELRRLGVEQRPRRARMADIRDNAAAYFEANGFRMAGNVSDGTRAIVQQELQNSVKYGRTPSETRQAIWSRLVAKGFTTRESVRTSEDDESVIAALDELWTDTEDTAAAYLDTLARTNLYEAMNEARYAAFTDPELDGFVVALRYSAVLDQRTTEICSALHDRVFKADSEVWNDYRPPNHYNCRSLLIPITQTDIESGDWDGVESEVPDVEPQAGFGKDS